MKTIFCFLLGSAIIASSAAMADPLSDCSKFVDGWKAAYNGKNVEALAGMYDATDGMYSSVAWTAAGREAIAMGFKQELGTGSSMTSIKCEKSTRTGDMGASEGTYTAVAKGPTGQDMSISGHWMATSVARDGTFFILTHLNNMQMPPPR